MAASLLLPWPLDSAPVAADACRFRPFEVGFFSVSSGPFGCARWSDRTGGGPADADPELLLRLRPLTLRCALGWAAPPPPLAAGWSDLALPFASLGVHCGGGELPPESDLPSWLAAAAGSSAAAATAAAAAASSPSGVAAVAVAAAAAAATPAAASSPAVSLGAGKSGGGTPSKHIRSCEAHTHSSHPSGGEPSSLMARRRLLCRLMSATGPIDAFGLTR
jgi:hypothetical protein